MKTNIFIDFDGVICNSNFLKEKNISIAYEKVIGKKNKDFFNYFTTYNGVPRELKLKKFVENENQLNEILKEYHILNSSINDLELAQGLLNYLDSNKSKNIYILSGGDRREIETYLTKHKIFKYFKKILCGPLTKNENLKTVKITSRDVFIGDSSHDFNVSKENNINFIFMCQYTQEKKPYDFLNGKILIVNNFNNL